MLLHLKSKNVFSVIAIPDPSDSSLYKFDLIARITSWDELIPEHTLEVEEHPFVFKGCMEPLSDCVTGMHLKGKRG